MPIYEYQCSECEHRFDRLQKMADAPLVTCPKCNEDSLRKLVSAPSFRLSGSGWYETDFKTDKDKKKNLTGDAGKSSKSNENAPVKKDPEKASKVDSKTKPLSSKTA